MRGLFGLGEDLVVAPGQEASAMLRVAAIVAGNKKKQDKYDADLRAYNVAVAAQAVVAKAQAANDAAFNAASASYQAAVASTQQRNQTASLAYDSAHAAWVQKKQAYDAVVVARANMVAADKRQSDSVIAQAGGAPPGYTGCITPAQRDAFASACTAAKRQASSVRGLGVSLASEANCYWQNLPLCRTLPGLPASPGPEPQKPTPATLPPPPKKPPALVMPKVPLKPLVPVMTTVPQVVVRPDAPPIPPPEGPRSLAVAGLLALVIVGGGAAYYFTRPKKKAAA